MTTELIWNFVDSATERRMRGEDDEDEEEDDFSDDDEEYEEFEELVRTSPHTDL